MTADEQSHYRRNGYVALPRLFAPEILAALHLQLRQDLDLPAQTERYLTTGPLLSKPAIEVYGHVYPPLVNFLWGLTPRVAQVAGCALLPTYCYFRIYQQGDTCRVHSDRPACEHSLSLTMTLSDQRPWALEVGTDRLDGPSGAMDANFGDGASASVAMEEGDAVMYQGVHHRHGRTEPNPNQWSAHLFLHWVDADGPYREQAFDRPTLRQAGYAA